MLLKRASHIIAVSSGTKEQIISVGIESHKITVIHNAVELSAEIVDKAKARDILGLDDKHIVIGYVGNLIQRKGIDILIRAFAELREILNEKTITLVVVGADTHEQNGAYIAKVNSIIAENNLAQNIHFIGYRSDAAQLMRAFDLFVMPSRMESFGVAIIEAMAAGVPIIASRSGSIPEVVQDGQTGLLFEPANHKELAEKMALLLRNKDLAQRLAEAACLDVRKRFAVNSQVEIFKSTVSQRFY